MFLIPHLLCLLLGLLALDTVHASPLTEVQLQNETLALDNVHTAASAEVKLQRGSCPMFWYSFNGRCYKYVATHLSWADAEKNCVSQGSNLVSIHSVGEHNFVRDLIKNFDPYERVTWIGMSDIHQEGWWTWSDGCKVGYTEWEGRMPRGGAIQNCVETNYFTKWNDRECSYGFRSVCASRILCP